MLVEDVMTTDVATVDADATLRDAVGVLLDRGVGSVVATTGSPPRKAGILTDTDVNRAAYQTDAALSALSVREYMSHPLVTVEPKTTLSAAVARMHEEHVKHLVVTKHMRLEGVMTPVDVARSHDDVVAEARRVDSRKPDWNR
jgi:signal-transduction protein with cAMP-binding, CBS, and nucleotidyltransferase domain